MKSCMNGTIYIDNIIINHATCTSLLYKAISSHFLDARIMVSTRNFITQSESI